jgi:signal transduction histidine kinase
MYLSLTSSPSLLAVLIVQSLLLIVGLFLIAGRLGNPHTIKTSLRAPAREIAVVQGGPQERPAALIPAGGEISGLNQASKQNALAMLQLAHELRSPLASIQNALDTILQGYTKDDAQLQDEMLNLARDRAVVMLGQVNEFLRRGAVQQTENGGKAGPVQPLDVLERLLAEKRVRAKWREVDLAVEVPDALSKVKATPEALEHLMSNLIDNAIKYTNPGGRVTVCLKEDERNVIGIVEDTGIGIAREDLSKIFDGFYRTDEAKRMGVDGTGLGLSIAKQMVDLYGGHLDVKSELGQGSRFSFVFPKAGPVRRLAPSQANEGAETKDGLFHNWQKRVVAQGLYG